MRIKMQDKVKAILLEKAVTRDNDFYLMYSLWQNEFNSLKAEKMNHLDSFDHVDVLRLMRLLNEKKLTHPSAITRARRKVQELHPETRGSLWEQRHKRQAQVKADLGYTYQSMGDEVI